MKYQVPDYDFNKVQNCIDSYTKVSDYDKGILYTKLLNQYKQNKHDSRWVYMYTDIANIVYDKYPKSLIHLLVLPFKVSYKDFYGTEIVANKVSEFKLEHLSDLVKIHTLCRFITAHLKTKYIPLGGIDIKIGYHLEPSMDDLHVHIITDDFSYSSNRQQKSFDNENFITIDEVEYELRTYGYITKKIEKKLKNNKKQKYRDFFQKNTRVYKVC